MNNIIKGVDGFFYGVRFRDQVISSSLVKMGVNIDPEMMVVVNDGLYCSNAYCKMRLSFIHDDKQYNYNIIMHQYVDDYNELIEWHPEFDDEHVNEDIINGLLFNYDELLTASWCEDRELVKVLRELVWETFSLSEVFPELKEFDDRVNGVFDDIEKPTMDDFLSIIDDFGGDYSFPK